MRLFITLLLITAAGIAGCSKSKDCDYIQARVIRYDCDRVILQLPENYPLGEYNWYESDSRQVLDNVVSCLNICTIRELTRAATDVDVYVRLKESSRTDGEVCMVCSGIPRSAPAVVVEATAISASACR